MAMQDPAGGGRLIVVDASALAADAVVYTVSDGKAFVGFLQSGTANTATPYKVNGIAQIIPIISGNGFAYTPLPVTWPAGTVVSKIGTNPFFLQGNEL